MKLSELLKAINVKQVSGMKTIADPEIVSIHYRADKVQPGGLFVAIPGFNADGHDYIDQALDRGAVAVIVEKEIEKSGVFVKVRDTRKALSGLAAKFFHHPSEKLTVIGITGTNGKTTTSYLIESMLISSGVSCGVIGTINYRYAGKSFENPMTTPESLDLNEILWDMADDGVTHVVMEASSHAIDLHRIRNIGVKVGVFTNLSQDHLDYHGDMNSYWECKKRLFTECLDMIRKKDPAFAVINCLNQKGIDLLKLLTGQVSTPNLLTIGASGDHHIGVDTADFGLKGIEGLIRTPTGDFEFSSSLVGKFNLENILCATGTAIALGLSLSDIKKGIDTFTSVPGRLEPVDNDSERFVFVDYAHTPDALEHVLSTLKSLASKRLICIFGCGGDRDRSKRSIMGSIAGKLSDFCIVTSDNPRTENKNRIIEEIVKGLRTVKPQTFYEAERPLEGFMIEPDRKKAIEKGILISSPGDTILIAGKGHETYQIIGTEKISFDDRLEAKNILKRLNRR